MTYQDWYSLHLLSWSYSMSHVLYQWHATSVAIVNKIGLESNCGWLCQLGLCWVLCDFLRLRAYLIIYDLHVPKMGHTLRCDMVHTLWTCLLLIIMYHYLKFLSGAFLSLLCMRKGLCIQLHLCVCVSYICNMKLVTWSHPLVYRISAAEHTLTIAGIPK